MNDVIRTVGRETALVIIDLQNDFLHAKGAYARGGDTNPRGPGFIARNSLVARISPAG